MVVVLEMLIIQIHMVSPFNMENTNMSMLRMCKGIFILAFKAKGFSASSWPHIVSPSLHPYISYSEVLSLSGVLH